jgi:hypothetical protein
MIMVILKYVTFVTINLTNKNTDTLHVSSAVKFGLEEDDRRELQNLCDAQFKM